MLSCPPVLGKPEKKIRASDPAHCFFYSTPLVQGLFSLRIRFFWSTQRWEAPFKTTQVSAGSTPGPPPNCLHHLLKSPRAALKNDCCHIKLSKVQSRLFSFQGNSLPFRKISRTVRSWQQGEGRHKQLAPWTNIFSTFWCQTRLSYSPLARYPWEQ